MKPIVTFLIVLISGFLFPSFLNHYPGQTDFAFPYAKHGLSDRQAAAHLLSRFTYGPKAGDIDAVLSMGLEKWFQQQLDASAPDEAMQQMLSQYDALKLSNAEVIDTYPKANQIYRMAVNDGYINKDSVDKSDRKEYRAQIEAYMKKMGMKPQRELFRQFVNQKILTASYSNNQLHQILTDFWFNHFNVSMNKNNCAQFIPAYERDVIRPNVTGKFEDLLIATAQSPAMLTYLDNFSSMGAREGDDQMSNRKKQRRAAMQMNMGDSAMQNTPAGKGKKNQGLNENYAREVMELHTLGVDGGYTQQDVTEAARVLTGWTIYPMGKRGYGANANRMIERVGEDKLEQRGFVRKGDFLFMANRHDNKEKNVLGMNFPANGGYEEGVKLLKALAHHPSTAKFISRKIAIRFVNDDPPQSLVDKMAKTFTDTGGDIKQVLITMASAPEFWSAEALREKIKSPFELAISAVRSLNAEVKQPYQLYTWINKMGQRVYFYQAPTGFPDKGQYWINTGALLNRMNFGLALASQRIPGIKIDLMALNSNREPESAEAALLTYSKMIMPERDLSETVKRLAPMLNDTDLVKKIDEAANKTEVPRDATMLSNENEDAMLDDAKTDKEDKKDKKGLGKNMEAVQTVTGNNSMLAQVVGVIIGSPEFQRR